MNDDRAAPSAEAAPPAAEENVRGWQQGLAAATGNTAKGLLWAMVGLFALSWIGLPNFAGPLDPTITGALEAPLLLGGCWIAWRATTASLGFAHGRSRVGSFPGSWPADFPLRVAAVLVALVVLGQLAKSKKSYPFMPLRMYGSEATGPARFLIYEALLENGQRERFRPSTVIADLGAARIVRGLQRRLSDLPQTGQPIDDATLDGRQRSGIRALRRLMSEHNAQLKGPAASGHRVREVSVIQVELSLPFRESNETRTLLARVGAEGP